MLKEQSSEFFTAYVIDFVRSLDCRDRAAFVYSCLHIIPQGKLDIDVADDENIFDLIVLLQNDEKLLFTDVSFLKKFLKTIHSSELLEKLNNVESRIAIRIILNDYVKNLASSADGFQHGGYVYPNIVNFLVATKEENQELFSNALENLNKVQEHSTALTVLADAMNGCEKSYSTLTALLVILGEIYAIASTEEQVLLVRLWTPSLDRLAEWILQQGGLDAFEDFIRKKRQKNEPSGSVLSSVEESLRRAINLIAERVNM